METFTKTHAAAAPNSRHFGKELVQVGRSGYGLSVHPLLVSCSPCAPLLSRQSQKNPSCQPTPGKGGDQVAASMRSSFPGGTRRRLLPTGSGLFSSQAALWLGSRAIPLKELSRAVEIKSSVLVCSLVAARDATEQRKLIRGHLLQTLFSRCSAKTSSQCLLRAPDLGLPLTGRVRQLKTNTFKHHSRARNQSEYNLRLYTCEVGMRQN